MINSVVYIISFWKSIWIKHIEGWWNIVLSNSRYPLPYTTLSFIIPRPCISHGYNLSSSSKAYLNFNETCFFPNRYVHEKDFIRLLLLKPFFGSHSKYIHRSQPTKPFDGPIWTVKLLLLCLSYYKISTGISYGKFTICCYLHMIAEQH